MRRAPGILGHAAAILLVIMLLSRTGNAATDSPDHAVLVKSDGSVVIPVVAECSSPGATNSSMRLTFGLPQNAPVRRWLEDDALPVCRSVWETNGIRYTETVLVTRRITGEWTNSNPPTAEAVVMVQIFGENFANDYAAAGAHLAIERAGAPLPLELRDDLVFSTSGASDNFLAALEIPASGIVNTNGLRLDFHGNIPPGNTGAMVVKFPLAPPSREDEIEQLRDLQFDQELQRVKRHWEKHGRVPAPVRFSN